LLRRSSLVQDRREGSWIFYCLAEPTPDGAMTRELYDAVILPYLAGTEGQRDAQALEAVREKRRERSRATHDALAERWVAVGQEFATGSLRAEAYSALVPRGMVLADLGCGAGFLTSFLMRRGARVIAVDHSQKMLDAARERYPDGTTEYRRGEMDALPLADGEVDAAFANLVWHHLGDMDRAAEELARVIRPCGTAVITDLLPHDEDWMRESMGDHRLGLRPDDVMGALARAGFVEVHIETIHDSYVVHSPRGEESALPLFLVRGTAPDRRVEPSNNTTSTQPNQAKEQR
jgi:SAM-dependent methyltransferase